MVATKKQQNIICNNKRARYDYHISHTCEAGLVLKGYEVVALRKNQVSLQNAYVSLRENAAFLVGCNIPAKPPVWEEQTYSAMRPRKLLLHKRELRKLATLLDKGSTIVPLKMYFNDRNLAKVEIAVGKGKKNFDKRKAIAERDAKRYGY